MDHIYLLQRLENNSSLERRTTTIVSRPFGQDQMRKEPPSFIISKIIGEAQKHFDISEGIYLC